MVVSVLQSMKRRQPNGKLYCLPCYMQAVGSFTVSIIGYTIVEFSYYNYCAIIIMPYKMKHFIAACLSNRYTNLPPWFSYHMRQARRMLRTDM